MKCRSLLFYLLILLSGCATNSVLPVKPEVSVAGLTLEKFGFEQQSFLIELAIDNPNRFDIPLLSTDFSIALSDRQIASGQTSNKLRLKAEKQTIVPIRFTGNIIKTWRDFSEVIRKKKLSSNYAISGNLNLDTKYFPLAIPFQKAGDLVSAVPGY